MTVRPVGQYQKSFAVSDSCYPVDEMWMILRAQLAEVLGLHLPCAACVQALVIALVDVLELFYRYQARSATL